MSTPDADLIPTREAADALGITVKTMTRRAQPGHTNYIAPVMKFPGPTGGYLFDRATIMALAPAGRSSSSEDRPAGAIPA